MSVIITIIHIFVAIALIMIVLLQTGKGADMGLAFGGGSSQTLFGTTGASSFLSKSTTAIAIVFMLTTFSLTIMWGKRNESSVMSDYNAPIQNSSGEQQTEPPGGNEKAQAETQIPAQETSERATQQAVVETPLTGQPDNSDSQPIPQDLSIPPVPVEPQTPAPAE